MPVWARAERRTEPEARMQTFVSVVSPGSDRMVPDDPIPDEGQAVSPGATGTLRHLWSETERGSLGDRSG